GLHCASLQELRAAPEGIGQNADAGYVVQPCQPAAGFQFLLGQRRVEERMVDQLRDFVVGVRHDFAIGSNKRPRGCSHASQWLAGGSSHTSCRPPPATKFLKYVALWCSAAWRDSNDPSKARSSTSTHTGPA